MGFIRSEQGKDPAIADITRCLTTGRCLNRAQSYQVAWNPKYAIWKHLQWYRQCQMDMYATEHILGDVKIR